MSLIVCNNSINYIENLTKALQNRSIDAYKANNDIQIVIKGIQVCRDTIDENGMKQKNKHQIYYHIQMNEFIYQG